MLLHKLVQKVEKGWLSMVRSRPEEIRRRIAKRRREKEKFGNSSGHVQALPDDNEKYGLNELFSFEGGGPDEEMHPLFKKEVFLFKILASACLVLLISILFHNHSATLDPIRNVVKKTMDTDIQFAAITDWYENRFGKPLSLLPFTDKNSKEKLASKQQYAIPASGKILENFQKNGQGIMIETGKGAQVKAMNEGIVRFAGNKEGIGNTVIIQHSDQTESWYGNLESINVNLYEYIEKGKEVGTVSGADGKDQKKGEFYFAIKEGDHFIDPIQVIHLE